MTFGLYFAPTGLILILLIGLIVTLAFLHYGGINIWEVVRQSLPHAWEQRGLGVHLS